MEMDWREIIKFSQKELKQKEKEKLCESLSWLEADDIELNFSDLKTLFRLCQDILKYKTEQVSRSIYIIHFLFGNQKEKIRKITSPSVLCRYKFYCMYLFYSLRNENRL